MVPKLFKSGRSFKKLGAYLLHDPDKAKTDTRVRWTHTLNLASDQPALAIDEMLWTYRSAEDLKRAAGLKAGRPLEHAVRHFSLNWHPSQAPSREHMIETVEGFLAHMQWQDHHALIVCHADKHPHVHVMLSAVHPTTGRALDSSFEHRRAQDWARAYEREHGLIFCDERLKPAGERTPSPTRATWEQLRAYEKEDDRAEARSEDEKKLDYFERADTTTAQAREWQALKTYQKEQRQQFFVDGKLAFRAARNTAYREVRQEFRARWNAYYAAKRSGDAPAVLASAKAALIKAQSAALDERRQAMCDALREQRDQKYDAILAQQRFDRTELTKRQEQGLRTYQLFDVIYPAPEPPPEREGAGSWRLGEAVTDSHAKAAEFHHAMRLQSDPIADTDAAKAPAVRPRDEKPVAVPAQRGLVSEMTDGAAEKQRLQTAREMTDQRAEKEQTTEQAVLRASWNRRRSRGGRD